MKKRVLIGLTVVGAGVLAAILLSGPRPEALVYQGKSIKDWVRQSYSTDQKSREQAVAAFQTLGSNAVPGLVGLLAARDSFLRKQIWMLAPNLPKPIRLAVLGRVSAPDAKNIRSTAARTLAAIGPDAKSAVPALTQALHSGDANLRWEAAGALSRIGGPGLPHLASALADKDPAVRRAAASVLGDLGPDATMAAPALLKALGDQYDYVRVAAATSLSKLGTNALPFLMQEMRSSDALSRKRAAIGLGILHGPRAMVTPPLLELVEDHDPGCRAQAIQSLATFNFPNPAIVAAFIAALKDPVMEVRLAAVQALAQARRQAAPAVSGLNACLDDPSSPIRESAARALGAIGKPAKPALPELARLADDKEERVRAAAKEAVIKIQEAEVK